MEILFKVLFRVESNYPGAPLLIFLLIVFQSFFSGLRSFKKYITAELPGGVVA